MTQWSLANLLCGIHNFRLYTGPGVVGKQQYIFPAEQFRFVLYFQLHNFQHTVIQVGSNGLAW